MKEFENNEKYKHKKRNIIYSDFLNQFIYNNHNHKEYFIYKNPYYKIRNSSMKKFKQFKNIVIDNNININLDNNKEQKNEKENKENKEILNLKKEIEIKEKKIKEL